MIKLERTSVMNLENAIRGMRNPLSSWHLSDSEYDEEGNYVLGENDRRLAGNLASSGSDHRKFIRQIFVSVDITAPLYWWKEFDTYKVGTVANSTSTMHKIQAKEFGRDDFSCDRLTEQGLLALDALIAYLEECRARFPKFLDENLSKNPEKCEFFLPTVVSELVSEGKADVRVLDNSDKWYGVTYKEDKETVVRAFRDLKEQGVYPENF